MRCSSWGKHHIPWTKIANFIANATFIAAFDNDVPFIVGVAVESCSRAGRTVVRLAETIVPTKSRLEGYPDLPELVGSAFTDTEDTGRIRHVGLPCFSPSIPEAEADREATVKAGGFQTEALPNGSVRERPLEPYRLVLPS